ncbi:MAG TPA: transposase [Thermodesulfobacteriota bacterium]|nr:transposase [Thermodesulfobacteriota bacterium]
MPYNSGKHYRRSVRLKEHDYSQSGAYFITICTYKRECLFGEIVDGEMQLNEFGGIVATCWNEVPRHFKNIQLDAFITMPNHVHGIVIITDSVGARHASPLQSPQTPRGPKPQSLGAIVGSFKSTITKRINKIPGTPTTPL